MVRDHRAKQALRVSRILLEVEALKKTFTPKPPAAMGLLRGEPRPLPPGERLRLARRTAAGRRAYYRAQLQRP